ncbi:MAG: helix-turn-helix domain-containing protein [Chloroflexota bacterium]
MVKEPTISISEASRILGVSEAALRQWTDEGKIKAFITPGGHRRYARAELNKLMSSPQKMLGIKDLVTKLEESTAMHREAITAHLRGTAWYSKLDEPSQESLASLGRHLLRLIAKSVAEPTRQEDTIKEVREVGFSFGETLAELGFPLTESVQAFIQHRDLIMSVTTHLMKKREGLNFRVVEAIPSIDHAMDEALVSLVAAHQQHKGAHRKNTKGGPSRDIHHTPAL